MQINIINLEYPDAIDETALIEIVRQLAELAQKHSHSNTPWQELTLHILSDDTITPVHKSVIGIAEATDVITQRYEPVPGEPDGLVGEIFVNLQCACREGGKRCQESGGRGQGAGDRWQEGVSQPEQWSVDQELALYIAHGCDHLNDAEDESEEGYQEMRARELSWLAQFRLTPVVIKFIL